MSKKAFGWRPALAKVALLLLLQAGGAPVHEALRHERGAVLHGEVVALFTAHLVHLGWAHALLNAACLLLCCAIAPARLLQRRWPAQAITFLMLAGAVSPMLLALSRRIDNYVGLSGVLYGLFACVLFAHARKGRRPEAAALVGLVAWVAWQWLHGPSADE